MSRGGLLTFVVIRLSSMSFSVIGPSLHILQHTRYATCVQDSLSSPSEQGNMNRFPYSRGNLVPRRIRHAQIQYCSGTIIVRGTSSKARDPPMIILGQFFGFVQSCLYLRREEVGFADGVKSYTVLSKQTSAGPVRFHHHGKVQEITHPCVQRSRSAFSAKCISPSTSSFGRSKLSMAKEYTETNLILRLKHISRT
jgi:hypothetical protein